MKVASQKLLRLQDVAKTVGVSAITLRRWLLSGKVPEVARDRNGWRIFSRKDIKRIRKYATLTKPPRK
jgi:DNA (cytosine-5)-methyltransferase 1